MTRPRKVLIVLGTRPEVIKMAPVIRELESRPQRFVVRVCVTAQHREMLDQVLAVFRIVPHHDLGLMTRAQSLVGITVNVLREVARVVQEERPDVVLVHGDTATTFAAALAAFYERVPVGHVEAGLRSGNIYAPWPEEMNRRLADCLTAYYYAPTERAAEMLRRESVAPERICITGNTVIDALQQVVARLRDDRELAARLAGRFAFLVPDKRLILVTGHRRENFGAGFARILDALGTLARRDDVQIVYPVHLNPNVQGPVRERLGREPHVHLLEPLDYLAFVYLMERSYLIVTDSGGIQEEAPALGKPVLVMRDVTERPEAVDAGTVRLVGTDRDRIVAEASRLLDDPAHYETMARAHNPYGDGHAAERIADHLEAQFDDAAV